MSAEELMDAIGELPEELLAPVDALRQKKHIHWFLWTALAAACLLIALLPLQVPMLRASKAESSIEDCVYSNQEAPENAGHYGGTGDVMAAAAESFRAEVLEVGNGWILVKPLEGEQELRSADKIVVSFRTVQATPEIKAGDTVEIAYSGRIQETYPAQITDATQIRIVE